jgi:hypothetical protein
MTGLVAVLGNVAPGKASSRDSASINPARSGQGEWMERSCSIF